MDPQKEQKYQRKSVTVLAGRHSDPTSYEAHTVSSMFDDDDYDGRKMCLKMK